MCCCFASCCGVLFVLVDVVCRVVLCFVSFGLVLGWFGLVGFMFVMCPFCFLMFALWCLWCVCCCVRFVLLGVRCFDLLCVCVVVLCGVIDVLRCD